MRYFKYILISKNLYNSIQYYQDIQCRETYSNEISWFLIKMKFYLNYLKYFYKKQHILNK